tara:strand:- start:293 stop:490 length:198 start_codon:yes stop_codon:yes gene_type:complete
LVLDEISIPISFLEEWEKRIGALLEDKEAVMVQCSANVMTAREIARTGMLELLRDEALFKAIKLT